MLKVSELKKSFGTGGNRLDVLKGVEMEIQNGELVALMGPSGSGNHSVKHHWRTHGSRQW